MGSPNNQSSINVAWGPEIETERTAQHTELINQGKIIMVREQEGRCTGTVAYIIGESSGRPCFVVEQIICNKFLEELHSAVHG